MDPTSSSVVGELPRSTPAKRPGQRRRAAIRPPTDESIARHPPQAGGRGLVRSLKRSWERGCRGGRAEKGPLARLWRVGADWHHRRELRRLYSPRPCRRQCRPLAAVAACRPIGQICRYHGLSSAPSMSETRASVGRFWLRHTPSTALTDDIFSESGRGSSQWRQRASLCLPSAGLPPSLRPPPPLRLSALCSAVRTSGSARE